MSKPALIDLAELLPDGSRRRRWFRRLAAPPLEHLLGVSRINRLHEDIRVARAFDPERCFFDTALEMLDIRYRLEGDPEAIPASGPLFVVANHPFGGADGLILGSLLQRHRPDFRLLANSLLGRLPDFEPFLIPVDPLRRDDSTRRSLAGMRAAGRWLGSGRCLATFPSGLVSHYRRDSGEIADAPWHPNVARLARRHRASVLPLFIEGANSATFHLLGMLHRHLRTLLLPRELLRLAGSEITVRVGTPIPPSRFPGHGDDRSLARYFQMRSRVLEHRRPGRVATPSANPAPLAPRQPVERLIADIESLPPDALLHRKGAFKVFSATASQIPHLLEEIGRTRELTFRPVGEGTGKPLDLDRFDQHYHHLFLWNDETCELVGAYRIALVDRVLAAHGVEGLYSSTIFDYAPDAFDSLDGGRVLELGRSYIVPDYQRRGTSLFLLWRGIVRFLRRHPGYTKLYGAVSISDHYHPLSRALMLRYLRRHRMRGGFENKIRARKNPACERLRSLRAFDYPGALPSLEGLSGLVSELEDDRKGVPTLLKHYLGLNGVILGIGIDQGFNDALDGFVLVDLERIDPAVLRKYEGPPSSAEPRA